jgi:hypothetical protein
MLIQLQPAQDHGVFRPDIRESDQVDATGSWRVLFFWDIRGHSSAFERLSWVSTESIQTGHTLTGASLGIGSETQAWTGSQSVNVLIAAR